MPEIMFIVVVLPQPEGPSSATNSLSLMVKVSAFTALTEPKIFVRFDQINCRHVVDSRLARMNRRSVACEASSCVTRLGQATNTQPVTRHKPPASGSGAAGRLNLPFIGWAMRRMLVT